MGGSNGKDEKLDIYMNPTYIRKMEDDARRFEVLKTNGQANMNRFYELLIEGFNEQYFESEDESLNRIIESMNSINASDEDKYEVANRIVKDVMHSEHLISKEKKNRRIHYRPSNNIWNLIDSIKTYRTGNDGVSQYFRNMLMAYCDLPMSERERIIFKDNYEKLLRSINPKTNSRISFKSKNSLNVTREAIPYKMVIGKEEMCNYLLCSVINPDSGDQTAEAFRLNRLVGICVVPGNTTINESVRRHLNAMERYGPQYRINKDVSIIVKLTDRGVRDYRRIYYGRPEIERIDEEDDHIYYFNCSIDQVFLYFRRFGGNAEILAPKELRLKMKNFHSEAFELYKDDSLE